MPVPAFETSHCTNATATYRYSDVTKAVLVLQLTFSSSNNHLDLPCSFRLSSSC